MKNTMVQIAAIYVAAAGLVTFLVFGWDKLRAIRQERRVPERTLLLLSFFGGGTGGVLGMLLFHHKTSKPGIWVPVVLFSVLQTALIVYWKMK